MIREWHRVVLDDSTRLVRDVYWPIVANKLVGIHWQQRTRVEWQLDRAVVVDAAAWIYDDDDDYYYDYYYECHLVECFRVSAFVDCDDDPHLMMSAWWLFRRRALDDRILPNTTAWLVKVPCPTFVSRHCTWHVLPALDWTRPAVEHPLKRLVCVRRTIRDGRGSMECWQVSMFS